MKIELKIEAKKSETTAVVDVVSKAADTVASLFRSRIMPATVRGAIDDIKNAASRGAVGDLAETYSYEASDGCDSETHKFSVDIPEDVVVDGLGLIAGVHDNARLVIVPTIAAVGGAISTACSSFGNKLNKFFSEHKAEHEYGTLIVSTRVDGGCGCVAAATFVRTLSSDRTWSAPQLTSYDAVHFGDYESFEALLKHDVDKALSDNNCQISWFDTPSDSYDSAENGAMRIWRSWAEVKLAKMRNCDGVLVGCEKRLVFVDGTDERIDAYYPSNGKAVNAKEAESRICYQEDGRAIDHYWEEMMKSVDDALGIGDKEGK